MDKGTPSSPSSSSVRLLYITGAMRSGSTALSLLLDQHPALVAVSQPEWLASYAACADASPCTCGVPVAVCPFWRSVAVELCSASQRPFDSTFADAYLETAGSWVLRPWERLCQAGLLSVGIGALMSPLAARVETVAWNLHAARENHLLFQAIRTTAHKPIVVDASKLPSRGKLLYMTSPTDTRILWLVRDGRAAAWSRMRRSGVSFEHATLAWLRAHAEVAGLLASVPVEHRRLVRYEDVCLHPERELARICELLGVPSHRPSRLLHKSQAHLVGGNDMRYRLDEAELTLDEHWKEHLTRRQLQSFRLLGGWLNRSFGYD